MKTYFTGEFSARRPITIGAAIVLTAIGLWLAIIWVPQMFTRTSAAHTSHVFGALLFIVVPLGFGTFLLYKIITNARTVLSITSEGISYGTKVYPWKDITEVGVVQKYTRRTDLYCTIRSRPYGIELLLSRGLSPEQIQSIFGALRAEVLPHHPHIELWDDDSTTDHADSAGTGG